MAKKRRKIRARRVLLLLMALLLLFFLLQLNQWLPGSWTGGGGSGFLKTKQARTDAAHSDAPHRDTPPTFDPTQVEAPKNTPSTMPPPEGVEVELLDASGAMQDQWRLGNGSTGAAEHTPRSNGRTRIRELGGGVRIRKGETFIRAGQIGQVPVQRLSFRLPPEASRVVRRPDSRFIRVFDALTGDPIPSIPIGLNSDLEQNGTFKHVGKTDNDGAFRLSHRSDLARVRIGPPSDDVDDRHRVVDRIVTLRKREPIHIRLPSRQASPVAWKETKFANPSTIDWELAIVDRDRGHRVIAKGRGNNVTDVLSDIPSGPVEGMVRARTLAWGTSPFMFQANVTSLPASLVPPKAKTLQVVVRDHSGSPLADATVTALTRSSGEGPGAIPLRSSATSKADGRATVPFAGSGRVSLLISARGHAPFVLEHVDANAPHEVSLQQESTCEVICTDANGTPISGAMVIGSCALGGVRHQAAATSLSQGEARLSALSEGPMEVRISARGFVSSLDAIDIPKSKTTSLQVKLIRGYPLHIAVNDPLGVPIAGVDIDIQGGGNGRPILEGTGRDTMNLFGSLSGQEEARTDTFGWSVHAAVPDVALTVRLSKVGYKSQTISNVRPGAVAHIVTLVPRN